MGIVLNIVAFLVTFALLHFSVTRGWSNGKHQILKRRLLEKAILPESERAEGCNLSTTRRPRCTSYRN